MQQCNDTHLDVHQIQHNQSAKKGILEKQVAAMNQCMTKADK